MDTIPKEKLMKSLRALAVLALGLSPFTALADTDGTYGPVGQIQILTDLSQTGTTGSGWVEIAGEYYYWGTSYCPKVTPPSDAQVQMLLTARIESIGVNPWYAMPVSKEFRCLTMFRVY